MQGFWKLVLPLMSNSMHYRKAKADVEDELCYLISLKFLLSHSWKPILNGAVPCSHGTGTTWLKTGSICCAQQCGHPPASVGCHFDPGEMTCLGTSWSVALGHKPPRSTRKTPICHSSTAFHQHPPFLHAFTYSGSRPFLQLKPFPSQCYWRFTWKRDLAGWAFQRSAEEF